MPENHSRAIEPPRAADGGSTKSKFVAREQCLLEEGRELQDGWSFIEAMRVPLLRVLYQCGCKHARLVVFFG
jgi:hypothetical protein